MPNNVNEHLTELIGWMDKSEKRHFKLYSARSQSAERSLNYVQLFDVIDRCGSIQSNILKKRIPGLTPKKLSDLKSNLYRHLLKSLRMQHSATPKIKLREMIDHAYVLYTKGLFMQSLTILAKAKAKAWAVELHLLVLEVIDFEKRIEARHVTRSHENRAQELTDELNEVRSIIR